MRLSSTSGHRSYRLHRVLPLAAAALITTSCVAGGGEDGSGDGGGGGGKDGGGSSPNADGGPLASSIASSTTLGSDLQLDVNSLERHGGDVALLKMTLTNNGEEDVKGIDILRYPSRADGAPYSASGVSLIDTKNYQRYRPLMRAGETDCLCESWQGDVRRIEAGDSLDFWVAFPAPPEDVTEMTVNTTVTPDMPAVPISEAAEVDQEIVDTPVDDPLILGLRSLQDDLGGDSSREETGDETSIMLSSDVLFEVNESELTSDADSALEEVAEEIDASGTDSVRIDGYTDDTGDDSINEPLSEDRAEEVRERLEEYTESSGLTFETAGHGSSDPVANNDTEEGRQKNRRVTITFEK